MLLITSIANALAGISLLQWITFFCVLVLTVYLFLTRNHGKLEKGGLYSEKPHILFGNAKELYTQELSQTDFYRKLYKKYKDHK